MLVGNPIYNDKDKDTNAAWVIKRVSQVEIIDGKPVTGTIRAIAEALDG